MQFASFLAWNVITSGLIPEKYRKMQVRNCTRKYIISKRVKIEKNGYVVFVLTNFVRDIFFTSLNCTSYSRYAEVYACYCCTTLTSIRTYELNGHNFSISDLIKPLKAITDLVFTDRPTDKATSVGITLQIFAKNTQGTSIGASRKE